MSVYKSHNEQDLIVLLKGGDEAAFIELYNRYKLRIVGNLFKLLRSEDLAGELSQELFMKIWDTRGQLNPEKSFKSYIFRISENMVMDFFRKVKRDQKLYSRLMKIQTELYSHIEENIIEAQESQRFREVVAMLPAQRREVFRLCKIEGKSYKEVAELLNISTSTVSDHLVKANHFLRSHFHPGSSLAISAFALAVVHGL